MAWMRLWTATESTPILRAIIREILWLRRSSRGLRSCATCAGDACEFWQGCRGASAVGHLLFRVELRSVVETTRCRQRLSLRRTDRGRKIGRGAVDGRAESRSVTAW